MNDWTSGYVTDIDYTFGYYNELNPLRLKLAFLNAGLVPPEVGTACELGFGQGVSANFHAAGSMVHWYGNDFNPSQAAHAREMAEASGVQVELVDDTFADFASREDLPEFDYIGLHGIWSWISDENRAHIVEFIRRKLKIGGVVYISYNTLPGWSAFAPLRYLMTDHAELIGADGHGIADRIGGALAFTEKLLATNPAYSRAHPQLSDRIKRLQQQSPHYLAHEYFNRDWTPMRFANVMEMLAPAKLNFACSASYLDHIDEVNLSTEQRELLQTLPDAQFRETVKDFMVNQQFRRDYWVKGIRRLTPLKQFEQLRAFACILVVPPSEVTLQFPGGQGEVTMSESIYTPIIDALVDYKVTTLEQLHKKVESDVSFPQLVQAAVLLTGLGYLAPVQNAEKTALASEPTRKLNLYILDRARSNSELPYLVSPLLGGGIVVGRLQQLFVAAVIDGNHTAKKMANQAWKLLESQGQNLMREGEALTTAKENLAHMQHHAEEFTKNQLPILKALQIL